MALYSYIKIRSSRSRTVASILSIVFLISGIGLLIWVLYPILDFELFYAPRFTSLINPIPNEVIKNAYAQNPVQDNNANDDTDYTKASVWFPKAENVRLATTYTTYSLSVPKVGIKNATVKIGEEDLSKSLVQFTGPLPPSYGNPVIFGHSTLLWFYNPKDYTTIFSKLPDLTTGDDILVTVDSVTYRYKVYDMKVVYPDDLSVLDQNFSFPNITLVTCVPQGTYLKRLIVKGKLVKI